LFAKYLSSLQKFVIYSKNTPAVIHTSFSISFSRCLENDDFQDRCQKNIRFINKSYPQLDKQYKTLRSKYLTFFI